MQKAFLGILAAAVAVGALAATASGQTTTKIGVIAVTKSVSHHGTLERGVFRRNGVRVGNFTAKIKPLGPNRQRFRAVGRFTGRGTLKVKGVFSNNTNNNRLPIIGGTGEFNGAAGKLKIHNLGKTRVHLTFLFVQ